MDSHGRSRVGPGLLHNTLVRTWPAVDLQSTAGPDLLLARIDGLNVTAVEEQTDRLRVFFSTTTDRDAAIPTLRSRDCRVTPVEVDDEDWARRSQQGLAPVTVGRITVAPAAEMSSESRIQHPATLSIVIPPSMGFGTGHHATTRLCLAALQAVGLSNRTVLDIGTGAGVLAIAAARLGASGAVGIDIDTDAIQAARENLALNPAARGVDFQVADLRAASLSPADVVVANLTGALLVGAAGSLAALVRPGGVLIVSGLLTEERDRVLGAFTSLQVEEERQEDGWLGITLEKRR